MLCVIVMRTSMLMHVQICHLKNQQQQQQQQEATLHESLNPSWNQ